MIEPPLERLPCPACGGAGGGPFGRAGSAWDDETYVCTRCEGVGFVMEVAPATQRPGLARAVPSAAPAKQTPKRKASA